MRLRVSDELHLSGRRGPRTLEALHQLECRERDPPQGARPAHHGTRGTQGGTWVPRVIAGCVGHVSNVPDTPGTLETCPHMLTRPSWRARLPPTPLVGNQ